MDERKRRREAVKAGKDIFEKLKVNAHAQSQKDAAATAKDGGINNSNAVVSSLAADGTKIAVPKISRLHSKSKQRSSPNAKRQSPGVNGLLNSPGGPGNGGFSPQRSVGTPMATGNGKPFENKPVAHHHHHHDYDPVLLQIENRDTSHDHLEHPGLPALPPLPVVEGCEDQDTVTEKPRPNVIIDARAMSVAGMVASELLYPSKGIGFGMPLDKNSGDMYKRPSVVTFDSASFLPQKTFQTESPYGSKGDVNQGSSSATEEVDSILIHQPTPTITILGGVGAVPSNASMTRYPMSGHGQIPEIKNSSLTFEHPEKRPERLSSPANGMRFTSETKTAGTETMSTRSSQRNLNAYSVETTKKVDTKCADALLSNVVLCGRKVETAGAPEVDTSKGSKKGDEPLKQRGIFGGVGSRARLLPQRESHSALGGEARGLVETENVEHKIDDGDVNVHDSRISTEAESFDAEEEEEELIEEEGEEEVGEMGEMGAESVQRQLSHKSLENDAVVGEDEEEFKTLEEVDEVLNKYTRFWQSRARKLRNQLSPTEEPTQLDQDVVAQKVAEVVPEPEDQLEPADSEEADVKSVDIPQRSTTIRLKKSSSEETFAKQYGGVHQRSKSVSFAEPMDIFLNLKRKRATSASGFLENTSSRYHQSQKALNLEHDRPGDPLSEKMVPSLRKSNEGSTVVSSRSISRKSSAYKVKASKEMKKGSAGSKTKSPQSTKAELKDDVRSRRSSPKLQSRTQSADDRSSSLRRSPQQNQSDRDGNSKIFPFKDLFIEDEFLRADPHRPSSRVSMAMARNVEKEALDGFVTDWWLQPDGYSTEASKAPKKLLTSSSSFAGISPPSPSIRPHHHHACPGEDILEENDDIYHHSCDPNKPVVYDEVAYQDRQQKRRQLNPSIGGTLKNSLFGHDNPHLEDNSNAIRDDALNLKSAWEESELGVDNLLILGTAMPIFKSVLAERNKLFGHPWLSAPPKMSQQSHFYLHMHSIPTSPDQSPEHYEGMEDAYSTKIANGYEEFNNDEVTDKAPVFFENKPESFNGVAFSFEEQASAWINSNSLYTPASFPIENLRTEDESIPFSGKLTRTLPRIVPEEEPLHSELHLSEAVVGHGNAEESEPDAPQTESEYQEKSTVPLKEANATELPEAHTKERENVPNRKVVRLPARSRSNTAQSEGSTRKRIRKKRSITGRSKSLPPSRGELDEQRNATGIKPEDPGGQLEDTLENNGESEVLQEDPVTFYLRRHRSSSHSITSNVVTPSSTRPGSASVGISRGSSFSSISRATDVGQSRGKGNGEDGKRGDSSSKGNAAAAIVAGPNLYEIVHSNIRRMNTLSPNERGRYPTLTDPGPPEESAAVDGEAVVEPSVEIEKLSQLIGSSNLPIPAFLRRRGILYGRIGKYEESLTDLSKAIQYDPFNSDALWHRHQLHLRLHNVEGALKDLDAITDSNKLHLGAFQSKARIYQEVIKEERQPGLPLDTNVAGMVKLAIVNYSQVIRLKPEDPDGYYQRACLFELENEMVYANEDFKMVRQLDPSNEHAIHNLAVYSFQRQLWDDAIQAFTKLLRLNALNGQAFLYRGRAYAYLAKWDEALRDLTMAIQLAPDRADVFYHRGCLLRERNRRRAIEDMSVSILLDDGPSNTEAFFQRAVLYYKLKKYDLAIIDYTTVVDLEPSKSIAWLNLGIIFMRYFNEFYKALECFNKAIQHDPIQIRAYLCRGDLFQILHSDSFGEMGDANSMLDKRAKKPRVLASMSFIDRAIRDYSKAIHMIPSDHLLYLYRGKLLLKQGRMKESTYDFHSAFELNSSIAQTFVQRALVLSFQRKYKQIISEFNQRSKLETIEDPALFMLIAKARVKCNDNEGAIRDLSKALEYNKKEPQIYLQRGICYENLKDWPHAIAEFSRCIAQNPGFAKAHYHRGLCKLHEGNSRGVVDLDRALKYDPKFFEAYLTRASYYHARGAYTEGIEDCNEALKLEPTSIRAHLLRGACKCKLHQYGLAIVDFTKAIQLDKACHFAFYNRAVTFQLLDDLDNAIKDYSIVLLLHNDSNAYRNRGLIYWKQGDAENALLDLYAARDNFPGDARLHGLLALCLQKVGRISESLDAFSSAIRVNPYLIEAYLGRGNVYASINDSKSARRDYARVIHLYPKCTEAYVNMGYTMQMENRFKKSWELFTMAIAIQPKCTPALEGRAVVHCSMRNYFGALVDVSRAISITPDNAEYLVNQGVIYQALEDNMSALQSYKAAIRVDSKYSLAFFNAANLYFSQRRWEMAFQYYNEALALDPKDVSAILNRGITQAMLEDMDGALNDFNQAIKMSPRRAEIYFNRGSLFQKLGKHVEADLDFSMVLKLTPFDSITYLLRGETRGHQARQLEAMGDFARNIIYNTDVRP